MDIEFDTTRAEDAFRQAGDLEKELRVVLKKPDPNFADVQYILGKLSQSYENVIFLDFEFAVQQEIESKYLWMRCHHRVMDVFRKHVEKVRQLNGRQKPVETRKSTNEFSSFLKNASRFYRTFLQRLVSHFRLVELVDIMKSIQLEAPELDSPCNLPHHLKRSVLDSVHRSLVYLGDLSRYRAQYSLDKKKHGKKWTHAFNYYNLSRFVNPNSGVPFNQLAVLATNDGNILNSTYYCLRALSALEPFPTSRDNMVMGFKKAMRGKPEPHDVKKGGKRETKAKTQEEQASEAISWQFAALFASIELTDDFPEFEMEVTQLLERLRIDISNRSLSSDMIHTIIMTSFSVICYIRNSDPPNRSTQEEMYTQWALQLIGTLSDIIVIECAVSQELSTYDTETYPADRISAVTRRLLPAMRISSKWLMHNRDFLLEKISSEYSPWNSGAFLESWTAALTSLSKIVSFAELPQLTHLLREDIETSGSVPLNGGTRGRAVQGDILGLYGLVDKATQILPNEETLMRIRDLLEDAMEFSQMLNSPIVHINGIFQVNLGGVASTPIDAFAIAPPQFSASPFIDTTTTISETPIHDSTRQFDTTNIVLETSRIRIPESVNSEPSMAFSLGAMVDDLVGAVPGGTFDVSFSPEDTDEQIVFSGRRKNGTIKPASQSSQESTRAVPDVQRPTSQHHSGQPRNVSDLLAQVFNYSSQQLPQSPPQLHQEPSREAWNTSSEFSGLAFSPYLNGMHATPMNGNRELPDVQKKDMYAHSPGHIWSSSGSKMSFPSSGQPPQS
ncbi:Protein SMG7 [Neolecta irregularis DAH-3]|uniref:Protein SMG7 n=1 Tax=Neolecta irregularis (strain DAH-3) TaxID=1198029 RepID=A0A1U7LTG4_NEOID|nr:Protein SMG7 [Neolecta irregularis DAH-3]|eukprot:OLL25965.1 Protein SMG7 [Neolecta irregularis DAH-3]